MATVRVEWVKLGIGPLNDGRTANVVRSLIGPASRLTVSAAATAAGSRPAAPAMAERYGLYARVTAAVGNSIVAWGSDPAAAQDNGILVMEGAVELIPMAPGDRLSFVEFA